VSFVCVFVLMRARQLAAHQCALSLTTPGLCTMRWLRAYIVAVCWCCWVLVADLRVYRCACMRAKTRGRVFLFLFSAGHLQNPLTSLRVRPGVLPGNTNNKHKHHSRRYAAVEATESRRPIVGGRHAVAFWQIAICSTATCRCFASLLTHVCWSDRAGGRFVQHSHLTCGCRIHSTGAAALVQAAGPDSLEQQALYSCLCSVAKLGAVGAACGEGQWGHLLFRVARVALLLLELQAGSAGQGSTGTGSSATAASSSTQWPSPPATPAATVPPPSLVLLGRCFQFWAHQLRRHPQHRQHSYGPSSSGSRCKPQTDRRQQQHSRQRSRRLQSCGCSRRLSRHGRCLQRCRRLHALMALMAFSKQRRVIAFFLRCENRTPGGTCTAQTSAAGAAQLQ
jgi:hypothetical protein